MANSRPQQLNMVADVDHWAFTNVDLVDCRYMWVVKNPGFFTDELTSPVVAAKENEHNVKWQLRLYWLNEKLRLQLKLVSADDECVFYKYNVYTVRENKEKLNQEFGSTSCSGKPESTRVGEFCVTKSQMREVPNEWLIDNTMTIVVHITMVNSIQQQSGMVTRQTVNCTANEDFGKFLNDPEFSDVTIIVGDSKFAVHKIILALRSEVFAAMFRHDLEEKKTNQIIIDDFDASVIREMLRYIYTGQSSEISQMLLTAADKYALKGLKEACIRKLYSNLTIKTVVPTLISADLHSIDDLKQEAIDFIIVHSGDIITSDTFREMVKNYPHLALDIFECQFLRNGNPK